MFTDEFLRDYGREVNEAKIIALTLFNEFLRVGAKYQVHLNETARFALYSKFGCLEEEIEDQFSDSSRHLPAGFDIACGIVFNTNVINEDVLIQNLNQHLFFEVLN